ncbi:MAG: hypothetical protein AAFW70_11995 [Cyanobacteria bacterium J06635_10]
MGKNKRNRKLRESKLVYEILGNPFECEEKLKSDRYGVPLSFDYVQDGNHCIEVRNAVNRGMYEYSEEFFNESNTVYLSQKEINLKILKLFEHDLNIFHQPLSITPQIVLDWIVDSCGIKISQLKLLVQIQNVKDYASIFEKEILFSKLGVSPIGWFDLSRTAHFFAPVALGSLGLWDISQMKGKLGEPELRKLKEVCDRAIEEESFSEFCCLEPLNEFGLFAEDDDGYEDDDDEVYKTHPILEYASTLSRYVGFEFSLEKGFHSKQFHPQWQDFYSRYEQVLIREGKEAHKSLNEKLAEIKQEES